MDRVLPLDQYGLLGLLPVIRMSNPDLNQLALGTDLTSMGLNLNSTGALYTTMGSPWTEEPNPHERPAYQIPSCYEMPPPALKASHLKKFHPRSLFFMFYSMPRDILQAYAAKELHTRGWRFHKDLRLWFTQETQGPAVAGQAPPPRQLVYFDSSMWEKRVFEGNIPGNGFMTDADMSFESQNAAPSQQGQPQQGQPTQGHQPPSQNTGS
jgi:CCR4-NOT transcription complex subunit 2